MYDEQTSVRCHGTTTKGEQCKLRARPDGAHCARHAESVANRSLHPLDMRQPTTGAISAPSDHVRRVFDNLPLSLRQRLDTASRVGAPPERTIDDAPRGATCRPSTGYPRRLALFALGLLSIWGVYAAYSNASGSGAPLPLRPAGGSACQQTVDGIHSSVPSVIADAQSGRFDRC